MQLSGLSSSSNLWANLNTSSTSATSNSSNSQNTYAVALANLMAAINAGNASEAQKDLSQVQQMTPSDLSPNSPLGQFLSNTQTALSNNDIQGAQSAVSTFQDYLNASSPASSTSGTASNGDASSFGQDMLGLFSAIGSGNLQGAQSAYSAISGLLAQSNSNNAFAALSGNGSSSMQSLLSQVGSALSSGDISTAQTALTHFLQSFEAGSLVNTSA